MKKSGASSSSADAEADLWRSRWIAREAGDAIRSDEEVVDDIRLETFAHKGARAGSTDMLGTCSDACLLRRNQQEQTVFHLLAQGGHVDALAWIIEHKLDSLVKIEKDVINAQDVDGYTALHFAAYNCVSAEIIRLLVLAGARVSLSDRRNRTPLHRAAERGALDAAKALVDAGIDLDVQDSRKWTALHVASYNGEKEIANLLLESGANTRLRNENGHEAVYYFFGNPVD